MSADKSLSGDDPANYEDQTEGEPYEKEIDVMPYIRGKDTEFHKMYFPRELAKFVHDVADAMKQSFPDTVRLILKDSQEKFDLFGQLEEGDYLVFDYEGIPFISKACEVVTDFSNDSRRDVT